MAKTTARGARPLNYRQVILLLLATGAGFYFLHTYSGPFKWLAERQLQWWGSYEESLTWVIVALMFGLPLAGLEWLVRRASNQTKATGAQMPSRLTRMFAWLGFGGIVAAVGLFIVALSGWLWFRGREPAQERFAISALEKGTAPKSKWVGIQGVLRFDDTLSLHGDGSPKYYIPLVSPEWKEKSPVTLFIEVREDDLKQIRLASRFHWFEGILSREGLPGLMRSEFESHHLRPAGSYYTLDLNNSPANLQRTAREFAMLGAGFFAVGAIIIIVQHRRERSRIALPTRAGDPRFMIKSIKGIDETRVTGPSEP